MEQRRPANRVPAGFSPENNNLSQVLYSPHNPTPHRNSLLSQGSDAINPYGFINDENQFLESSFSRLNLSESAHEHQVSPYPVIPSDLGLDAGAGAGAGEMARQVADPFRSSWYESQGLNSNAGLPQRGGLMGFYNGGVQDFSGVHPNLMVGQGAVNCGTGTGTGAPLPLRGCAVGAFLDSVPRNNVVSLNSLLSNGGNYQRGDSFLLSKKHFLGGLNVQPSNVPATVSVPVSPSTRTENLDWLLSNEFNWLKYWSFQKPSSSDFRLGKDFESLSLQDFRGKIIFWAKDQEGSRILQERLNNPNEGEIEMVVSEVVSGLTELLKNQVGSFFFQKLFGVSSDEQRTRIVKAVTENPYSFVTICVNSQGARTLQNFMDSLITQEHISLFVSAISHNVVALANDSNGQHVVRQCLLKFSHEYNEYLLNEVANNCFQIGTDKSGCCVIQCCMDNARGKTQERLIKEIVTNALPLSEDPFGNYVVQHLMGKKIPGVNRRILAQLKNHLLAMSCDKYASNVVEKFLINSEEDHSSQIIFELLHSPNAVTLLTDPYGNYVVQKALSFSVGYEFHVLCKFISQNASSMRTDRFGQKILSCFEKDIRCKKNLSSPLSRRFL